jgi:hypothetical protein
MFVSLKSIQGDMEGIDSSESDHNQNLVSNIEGRNALWANNCSRQRRVTTDFFAQNRFLAIKMWKTRQKICCASKVRVNFAYIVNFSENEKYKYF